MRGLRGTAIAVVAAGLLAACGGGSNGGSNGGSPPPAADTAPPTVPQALTARAESADSILLSWQASTDAGGTVSGYRIYRDGGATALASVTGTSYRDTGLAAGMTHVYAVSALDAASPPNESSRSASVSASTPSTPGAESGLDARPSNPDCVAGDRPETDVELATERAFVNLPPFASPVLLLQAPGDASRWFVVEQAGTVRAFEDRADVAVASTFVDIRARVRSGGEQGLLGMAFHPDFPDDPRVYLSYTNASSGLVSRIAEFRSRDGGLTLDPDSETILLTVPQPSTNHNGGHLAFGPDRMLYIGFGDGGGGGDPWGAIGNGQLLTTLLGKLLRIDVEGSTGDVRYRIPPGNPYAGNAPCADGFGIQNCPEIHAFGLRNPWRWSFDRGNGTLWLADVGQGALEEVNRVVAGGNYGWRCFEGTRSYNPDCGLNAGESLPPVAQYGRTAGQSVTGGYVYRGDAIPALHGRYVFGDFVSGRIWHIAADTAPTREVVAADGFASGLSIAAFGEGLDGELYVVDYGGTFRRLRAAGATGGGSVASRLSATGCVLPGDPAQPSAGLIPYAPNAAFWSDGADKERYLALPDGTSIALQADGDFELPVGSVLLKHFRLGERLVETRLFMRHSDGDWAGYSYAWNAEQSEAMRVVAGRTATIEAQEWVFQSEAQCLACHTQAAGRSLGLEVAQLNGELRYAQTGRTANQLATFDAIGLFAPPLASAPATLPALPDPAGDTGTLAARARAWLHTNCAHCHRPNGGTPTDLDLRHSTALSAANACDRAPQAGDLGLADARILAPGAASRSVLLERAQRRDQFAMPPLASTVVDAAGAALLAEWIDSLENCD